MEATINIKRVLAQADQIEFRRVAFGEFLRPSQLQAILWFTWKRINQIVYDGNYNLYDNSDCWKMRWQPEEIRPYYI